MHLSLISLLGCIPLRRLSKFQFLFLIVLYVCILLPIAQYKLSLVSFYLVKVKLLVRML